MSAHPPTVFAWPRLMAIVLLAGMLSMLSCAPSPQPRIIPLTHSAYVWKQGWTARMTSELAGMELPARLTALNVLVGECGLSSGRRAVRPPWKELSAHGRPLSLSVRIGTRKAVRGTGDLDLTEGFDLLLAGLAEARAADIAVASLQVDFDCPERLLAAYAEEILAFKAETGGLPVTITTLPAWLDADGFDELIASADGWTLQLHGTSRPKLGSTDALFAEGAAIRWTRQAVRFGRPFRVALPTYAYLACYGKYGDYLGMHAEQAGFPSGTTQTMPLPADPAQIQTYLRALKDARFELVTGVDWFRLPFPGDRQNWTMHGLDDVLAGRELKTDLEIVGVQAGGLYDLAITNSGHQPVALPSVQLEWGVGQLIGLDATYAWQAETKGNAVTFSTRGFQEFLAPGERRVVGWLRIDESQPITSRLIK
jgi:hypothetical protein